ncbi:hypothetical protein T4B_7998 [Trichinella pseudospiralis]|uniref:Vacuolar ATPase assembly protein VMA22 n=1 Tax=Trichinella pseudospiralis TaxID=6337 RepID=A0A0V1JPQ7_TRIPS|nr:hypothetical protein T4A_9091 [Trichinella pseudospiralis]KRZ25297.1 hypothetical protein T4B_7998 [Trichinella pseudospiralis]KRZ36918.1 hypothetical protein T4C_7755 [Trichinella pseudospiralis]
MRVGIGEKAVFVVTSSLVFALDCLLKYVMENDVDEEIFKLLDCMNEQIHLKLILERKMKECWMAMAKARESMGSLLNISALNLDNRNLDSMSTVVVEKGVNFILRQCDDDFSRKQVFKKFGLLTPIHLVTAQKHSIAAIQLVCNIASNQTKLVENMAKFAEHDLK